MTKIVLAYLLFQGMINSGLANQLGQLLLNPRSPICITYWLSTFLSILFYYWIHIKNPGYISNQQQPLNLPNDPNISAENKLNTLNDNINQKQNKLPPLVRDQSPDIPAQQMKPEDFSNHYQKKQQQIYKGDSICSISKNVSILAAAHPQIQKKYCRVCLIDQPYRTKHCHECEKCVMTFDHHCPWIENCVGQKNRPLFFIFLLIHLEQIIYAEILLIYKFDYHNINLKIIGIFIVILVVFFLVFSLWCFHFYLMLINITTWQYLSWQKVSYLSGKKKQQNPFNYGIRKNIMIYWKSGLSSSVTQWNMI